MAKSFHEKGVIAMMMQLERGKEGTPHIQGCFKFKNARARDSIKNWEKWFLETCHDWDASVAYCSKKESREFPDVEPTFFGITIKAEKYTYKLEEPYEWQQEVLDLVAKPPNPRHIYW